MQERSSNYRDLLAVLLALQAAQDHIEGTPVQVLTDNSTAVAHLNRQGGTKSKGLIDLSFINFLPEVKFLFLGAGHLSGKDSVKEDYLS